MTEDLKNMPALPMQAPLILEEHYLVDSHCHVDFAELYAHKDAILQSMQAHCVKHALCVSVELESLASLLEKVAQEPAFYASVGVHPDYENVTEPTVEQLCTLAQHAKVIAIGETGLDYYRNDSNKDMAWQRNRFANHIEAAKIVQKPLIIHTRQAKDDTLSMMKNHHAESIGGVLHCFTESYEMAKKAIDMGFYISLSGIISFKNAKDLQETAKKLPLDCLLIETDSPYLAPIPYRGKQNQPALVYYVAQFLAQLKGVSIETIAKHTTHNFNQLFKLN